MTKTIRSTDCLVVALSALILGCAKNLPELPIDIKDTSQPTQASTVAPPLSAVDPVLNSVVTYEETKVNNTNNFPLELIANDLVKALAFISGMDPQLTPIYAPTSSSEFDNLVKNSMLQKGYSFDGRRFQPGTQQLTTSFIETNTELQPHELTAIMALNSVLIKRTYAIKNNTVTPKTSYIIRGIKPELVDDNAQVRTI